jgi:hypothetical protein
MKIETLIWGFLPTAFAISAMLVSGVVAWRSHNIAHWCASVVVLAGVVWSLFVLYRIFILNAWPTYLPHYAIAGVAIVAGIQFLIWRIRKP